MDAKGMIMWAVFIAVCAAIYIVSRNMNKQTEEYGTETTGVISRIEDTMDPDDISLIYYVQYRTSDGEEVEGILFNPTADLEVGQQVRIKYHPVYKANARLINAK